MKTHVEFARIERVIARTLVLMLLFALAPSTLPAQAPPNPIPAPENILSGALVIPMDNVNQGNAGGTTFNLRAYGLANLLLQNDVPVKWVIKPGKSKDDVDFSANVTRIAGNEGTSGPADLSFAGGPFVVTREFDIPAVRNLIDGFNSMGTPVTVYKTNADTVADVRYTLTHKPRIAVGPDGGNFGAGVYQSLFDRAGITDYVTGIDNIDQAGSCFTLATQGHQTDPTFVNTYRNFVQGGGNLILQCASVGTFENHPMGHFQTTGPGYTLFTSNNPPADEINSNAFVFPEGSMPFNQFLGMLADQDGAVTEYAYAPGAGPANGNRVSVHNGGSHTDKFVATVSHVNGESATGGVVFEFGGHNYNRLDEAGETDSELAMLNGQRMQLNTVFVPAGRVCTPPTVSVVGYKSVRRINPRMGGPAIAPNDTLEWTIDYVNNTPENHFQFQVRDIIGQINGFLTLVPGSNVVTLVSGGAMAERNPGFDGAGDDASADMLAPGAFLPSGGRIQIRVQTTIDGNVLMVHQNGYTVFNQTTARSVSLPPTDSTKSDAIDTTNTNIFNVDTPPDGSVDQTQNGAIINPTMVPLGPTAGEVSIEGRVITADGEGIMNALIVVVSASTGEPRTLRTNSLGFFRMEGLDAGGTFLVTVTHKRYRFPTVPTVLTLGDSVTGLTFTGSLPTRGGAQ